MRKLYNLIKNKYNALRNKKKEEKTSEEIKKETYTILDSSMVTCLYGIFGNNERKLAMNTYIFKVCEVMEARYTYKAIHEDVSKEERDTYIAMARYSKQFKAMYIDMINKIEELYKK